MPKDFEDDDGIGDNDAPTADARGRAALGVTDGLLRLSAGIEDAFDLIADLDAALEVFDREDLAAE